MKYYNSEIFYLYRRINIIVVSRYLVQRRERVNIAETIEDARRFITFHFL